MMRSSERKWALIPGWPGYRVSDDGVVECRRNNAGFDSGCWSRRAAKPDADGYFRLTIHHRNRSVFIGVHTLVLICHGPPRPPGNSMALHGNGNPQDNHIDNLRWGFGLDNASDRELHGNTAACETHGCSKLTWSDVDEIRVLYAAGGISMSALAKKFKVNKKTILNVIHHKTWSRQRQTAS